MKLASIIQNGMQPPLKIDVGLLKFTSISTSNQFPKWVNLHLTNSPNLASGVCRNAWLRKLPVVRAKGVEQEEESVSSVAKLENFDRGR
ncbi:hypothetical protein Hanom_Chr11g01054821 [Helianthus anomalus]